MHQARRTCFRKRIVSKGTRQHAQARGTKPNLQHATHAMSFRSCHVASSTQSYAYRARCGASTAAAPHRQNSIAKDEWTKRPVDLTGLKHVGMLPPTMNSRTVHLSEQVLEIDVKQCWPHRLIEMLFEAEL